MIFAAIAKSAMLRQQQNQFTPVNPPFPFRIQPIAVQHVLILYNSTKNFNGNLTHIYLCFFCQCR